MARSVAASSAPDAPDGAGRSEDKAGSFGTAMARPQAPRHGLPPAGRPAAPGRLSGPARARRSGAPDRRRIKWMSRDRWDGRAAYSTQPCVGAANREDHGEVHPFLSAHGRQPCPDPARYVGCQPAELPEHALAAHPPGAGGRRTRLLGALLHRAPLPRRGLRGVQQPGHAGPVSGHADQAHPGRPDGQHPALPQSAAARRRPGDARPHDPRPDLRRHRTGVPEALGRGHGPGVRRGRHALRQPARATGATARSSRSTGRSSRRRGRPRPSRTPATGGRSR